MNLDHKGIKYRSHGVPKALLIMYETRYYRTSDMKNEKSFLSMRLVGCLADNLNLTT